VAGLIRVALAQRADCIVLTVADNGCGFPSEDRERLTEPYVTTRSNGTGLGLAIVRKIVEDHDGKLALEDVEGGGACVRLEFSREEDAAPGPAPGHDEAKMKRGASYGA
jgi:two-component system nitrogen regulation sensor histidine kinase NtrY